MPATLTDLVFLLNLGPIITAMLSVAAAVVSFAVIRQGALVVLEWIGYIEREPKVKTSDRGDWDQDVYRDAMQELHSKRRAGVVLDRESAEALRDYSAPRRRAKSHY